MSVDGGSAARYGRPTLRAALLVAVLLAIAPAAAQAQQPVLATNGSTLAAPPNLVLPGGPNQCLARPYIGLGAGSITFLDTGQASCMWWSVQHGPDGAIIANTYVPRGAGAVTRVRVSSGAAPAPLRFAIVSSGSGLCCTTKAVSEPVEPAPGQINEFAVNLPAGSGVGDLVGSQYNDILVVVAVGPGTLPVNDRGAHGFLFDSPANQARAAFLHPALALGESNTDVGTMDGYEVLLQYDWCGVPMTGSNLRPVAPANPQTACSGPPPSPLRAATAAAAVRRNVAALRLACLLDTVCAGTLALRPRAAGGARAAAATRYGRAAFNIAPGAEATVKVALSRAGRKAFKGRRKLAIDAVVSTGGSRWTLPLKLKRKR